MSSKKASNWLSPNTISELLPSNNLSLTSIFDSLKYRDFRLYFMGQCISLVGTWMQQVAMSWLIYNLTGSVVLLATVVFMAQIPTLIVTPFSSVFVDRYNRRNILILTQTLSMVQATILTILVLTNTIEVWHLLSLSLFIGLVNSLDMPTRQAFYTSLVPSEKLSNAVALNSAVINGARLIGPAIGGILIGIVGEGGCFLINAVSYIFVIGALLKIANSYGKISKETKNLWHSMKEGYQYTMRSVPIRAILFLMTIVSFFIFPVMTFIPAYVKDILHGDSFILGLLMSAVGIGSFSSAIYLAARKSVLGLGKVIVLSSIISSLSIIPFFFVTTIWIAFPLAIFLGFGMICSVSSANTLLQTLSSGRMRGRVMGYFTMGFIGGGAMGSLTLGPLIDRFGMGTMMTIGGVICILSALFFERYRPIIRRHAHSTYVKKGIIEEIAKGIDSTYQF